MSDELNIEAVRRSVEDSYGLMINQELGVEGIELLKRILDALNRIYHHIAPDSFPGQILIFATIGDSSVDLKAAPTEVVDPSVLAQGVGQDVTIQVLKSGKLLVWNNKKGQEDELAKLGVVYRFEDGKEEFIVKEKRRDVLRFSSLRTSQFVQASFSDLRLALENFGTAIVRHSKCPILEKAWNEPTRIFFVAGPEHLLRDSLIQFLRARFRGHVEIRPEQNTGTSNPVDVKVSWLLLNRLALIEIKWLGKSVKNGTVTVTYTQARALEGAEQLAGYLDRNMKEAPYQTTRGYLVVVDGRRRGKNPGDAAIDSADGLHYENEEVAYDPEYHNLRHDFDSPLRLFARPEIQ